MELKTRSTVAVLPSDVIQLSAQRIALEDELGLQVTDEAFVLISVALAPVPEGSSFPARPIRSAEMPVPR